MVAASEAVGGLAGLLGHAGFAALPKVAMLEILSFLPAEVNDSTLSSRQRDAIVVTLKEALPTVFGFVTAEVVEVSGDVFAGSARVGHVVSRFEVPGTQPYIRLFCVDATSGTPTVHPIVTNQRSTTPPLLQNLCTSLVACPHALHVPPSHARRHHLS